LLGLAVKLGVFFFVVTFAGVLCHINLSFG
jgi:hypothetical protein